ncbi:MULTISPECIES: hypothetical protein [Rhodococcus]|uniref:hypothetical protein n=1 Tax=Rhodococcus TaxID=1827 RepID=UPI0007AE95B9|nr:MULTISPECIES: hypothetical protein [Rhodococcus]KZL33185.1 hypothetical protein A3852_12880 [Rhodococcus qingshengii]MBX9150058.1 hypothetical protein [Rhodococcus qingshengii]MCE4161657.1 hypothetical protein [Rhodococcus sp. Ni2]
MATYHAVLNQSVSAVIDVEADNLDDAIDKAYADAPSSLCHHCADKVEMSNDWEIYDVEEVKP